MDHDVLNTINIDIMLGRPPDKSTIKYGPDELAYRKRTEVWLKEMKKTNPNATLDVRE